MFLFESVFSIGLKISPDISILVSSNIIISPMLCFMRIFFASASPIEWSICIVRIFLNFVEMLSNHLHILKFEPLSSIRYSISLASINLRALSIDLFISESLLKVTKPIENFFFGRLIS